MRKSPGSPIGSSSWTSPRIARTYSVISVLPAKLRHFSDKKASEMCIRDRLSTVGVDRAELANKLRQPLGELVGDNKIHTIGEKRLMKYHSGPKKK